MKKLWLLIGILVCLFLAIILIITQAKKESEEIKIGAILPLTGSAAQFGQWKKEGIDIALNEINNSGGVNGKVIKVIYEDSQGDPKIGLAAIRKLMTVDNTKIVFSDLSGVTLSILPVTKKKILVITSATHPEVTSGKYLAIRNYLTPAQEASAMAKYAKTEMGFAKVAILYWNDEAMRAYDQKFVETFHELGGKTFSEVYDIGTTDFRSQLGKIKVWQPEALYIAGWREVGTILRQAIELGIKARFLGTITFDSPMMLSLAGNAAEGAIYTVPAFGGPYQTAKTEDFIKKYKKLHQTEPEAITGIWYDTMYVLAYAFKEAGTEPTHVFNAIIKKDRFSGTLGDFHFDKNGNIVVKIVFKTVRSGNFQWVEN
jgi:branched-chain amino acid transport system substrate-binding protein